MTVGKASPALDAEVVSALRELNNAAIVARKWLIGERGAAELVGHTFRFELAQRDIDALDAAIADAGEALARAES